MSEKKDSSPSWNNPVGDKLAGRHMRLFDGTAVFHAILMIAAGILVVSFTYMVIHYRRVVTRRYGYQLGKQ